MGVALDASIGVYLFNLFYMGVSKNRGTPKSSILIGFSTINHPFWGTLFLETLIYANTLYHEKNPGM